MNKSTDKINLQDLAQLCAMKGMRHVVISPGSRNAPLIVAFNREEAIQCHIVVDERSAAYYAVGIAQQFNEPVGVICTSGTALLNYAPAVAEAYYQRLPLVVMSADRPEEWIDQDDSQTIPQFKALDAFVKASYQLPVERTDDSSKWYLNRMINEALLLCMEPRKGPVHLNIPLNDPLCEVTDRVKQLPRSIERMHQSRGLDQAELLKIASWINQSAKVMILASMQQPSQTLQKALSQLAIHPQVIVLTETVANLQHDSFVGCIDRTICRIEEQDVANFMPDILISFGGPIVSKMMKKRIRQFKPAHHWFVQTGEHLIDTYGQLSLHINLEPEELFPYLVPLIQDKKSVYSRRWKQLEKDADERHREYLQGISWSDMKAFEVIVDHIPAGSHLQLSNGTSIRYHQLFKGCLASQVNSNRGTSGIDGSTSTAAGAASVYEGITTLVTGDISFLYDTNGLWNNYLSSNLKIIVMNNGGGGIFRFIKGPSQLEELETFFETPPRISIVALAEAYGLAYYRASDEGELKESIKKLYATEKASILEVITPREINDQILKEYFR